MSNNDWRISKRAIGVLFQCILSSEKQKLRFIEFGSGKSTFFLCELGVRDFRDYEVVSFDDSEEFAFKGKYPFLDLKIRSLVETDDIGFERMFSEGVIIPEVLWDKKTPLWTRQRNNFYKILDGDISGKYDFVILDGPNGNGRSLAWLYLKEHLVEGAVILVDDVGHYDFVDRMLSVFSVSQIVYDVEDNFAIFRVTK